MLPRSSSFIAAAVMLVAASAVTAQPASHASVQECTIAGTVQAVVADTACPADAMTVLSSLRHERKVPRLDNRGMIVLDRETGEPQFDTLVDTYGRFLELAAMAGAGELLRGSAPHTVLAVSDRALGDRYDGLKTALGSDDPAQREGAKLLILSHFFDEPVWGTYFSASTGKIWTLAGRWQDGGKPVAFNYASASGPVMGGRVPVQHDIPASNAVIHLVDGLVTPSK